MRLTRPLAALLLAGLLLPGSSALRAKSSTWKDLSGESFRAEPAGVLGPFAIFRSGRGGKRVLLRGLPPEECVRFYEETAKERAPGARGSVTKELLGRVMRVEGEALVPVDLATRATEARVYLAIYASHNDGESWKMLHDVIPLYRRLKELYGDQFEAVFFGVRHKADEHRSIAKGVTMPWLVADFAEQDRLRDLARFAPAEGVSLVALTAQGVPLVSTRADSGAAMRKFVDELGGLMALTQESDGRTWKDRLHYLVSTQRVAHAQDRAEPVLVGDPLAADGLRQLGIRRVQASLEINAEGGVTAVSVARGDGVTDALARPLRDGLKKAIVVPAVAQGQWVASTYDYDLVVPTESPQLAAARKWLGGELTKDVPLTEWWLLKPIRVPQQDILQTDHVAADETVVLKPVEAVTDRGAVDRASQKSAFLTDWFATQGGAAAVRPAEGVKLTIDGQEVGWKKARAAGDGLVNLQDGLTQAEYSIGYAWTEFEVAADMPAWLGLGSDDGVKIWLNGELVHDKWIRRISRLDDDVVPLALKAGKNQLLIKIQNVSGDWSFVTRLRTE